MTYEQKRRIGQVLRTHRRGRSMSLKQLGEIVGLSAATLSGVERGVGDLPDGRLAKLARAVGLSEAEVLAASKVSGTGRTTLEHLTPFHRGLLEHLELVWDLLRPDDFMGLTDALRATALNAAARRVTLTQ